MTQTLSAAIGALAECSTRALAEPTLSERLRQAGDLLKDDLSWVESALRSRADEGPSPGKDAARHLLHLGGKRVRPTALLLSAACFGAVPRAARHVAVCVELIHSATLLHDDVIDEGEDRRGQAASRMVWGNAVSVLGGDLLLTHALTEAQQHAPQLMPDLLATLRQLVDGEIVQLRGRAELEVSERVYEAILRDKTASLFRFATGAGAQLAGASARQVEKLRAFGDRLGMAFQLVDDLLDYTSSATGKTMFADLKQGKLTLPLVLAVQRRPSLLALLQEIRGGRQEAVEELRAQVVQSGVCEVVQKRAASFTSEAVEQLQGLPASPARALLQGVAAQLVSRTS